MDGAPVQFRVGSGACDEPEEMPGFDLHHFFAGPGIDHNHDLNRDLIAPGSLF